MYLVIPSDIFWGPLYPIGWSIITWLPMLVSGMMAAYIFQRVAEYYENKRDKELEELQQAPPVSDDPGTLLVEGVRDYSKVWGIVCDCCSVLLFFAAVAVAAAPNCLCVYGETFEAMRPGESLPEEECKFSSGREDYVWACGITYNEFADFIQPDPHHKEYGRFPTNFGGAFGYLRAAAPLMLLWISSMAFGAGYTSRLFSSKVMTTLAPLGYPVYLLHIAVARYYWLATRGWDREHWFEISGEYPFPVQWFEVFIILCITIVLGYFINSILVPPLMPHSISLGVKVCTFVSSSVARCQCFQTEQSVSEELSSQESFDGQVNESTYKQVQRMVRDLTGVDVNRSIKLRYLGLDSLGAAALLGMLHASVPAAKKLTILQLAECETVGCLSDLLDESRSETSRASTSDDDEAGQP